MTDRGVTALTESISEHFSLEFLLFKEKKILIFHFKSSIQAPLLKSQLRFSKQALLRTKPLSRYAHTSTRYFLLGYSIKLNACSVNKPKNGIYIHGRWKTQPSFQPNKKCE